MALPLLLAVPSRAPCTSKCHLPQAGCAEPSGSCPAPLIPGPTPLACSWRPGAPGWAEKGLIGGDASPLTPSARMSASQCLEHPWLNNLAEKAKRCNRQLKSQVLLKKYVMRRRWKVWGTAREGQWRWGGASLHLS